MRLDSDQAARVARELLADESAPVAAGPNRFLDFADGRLGQYRLLRRIARGGMSTVYEALEEGTRRRVALKLIDPRVLSRQGQRWFQQEIRVLGRLDHPGIARILGTGTFDTDDGSRPYFAMEFIRGRPITEHARAAGLSIRQRLELIARVCDAVQYAHGNGVIHRDLKPDNILVAPGPADDPVGRPRILDFGVARATESDLQVTSLRTEAAMLIGTLPYMSPEQMSGELADARTDVYALGVLAFELLSGRLPHDLTARNVPEAARIVRDEEPVRLGRIARELRGDVETIVHRAMSADADQRYATASELGADLRRFLNHEPINARPPGSFYRLTRFAIRHRVLLGAVASVFAVLVVALAVVTASLRRAVIAERDASSKANQAQRTTDILLETIRELATHAGTGEQRRVILEAVREQLVDAHRDDPAAPDLQVALADAIEGLGDLERKEDREQEACTWHRQALVLREDLAARFPDDPELQAGLSIGLAKVGDGHKKGGMREALRWYTRALRIQERLVEHHPENPTYHDHLAWSHLRIGHAHEHLGEFEAAERSLAVASSAMARVCEMRPDELGPLAGLFRSEYLLADMYHRAAPERMRPHAQRAVDLARQLVHRRPWNQTYGWYLSQGLRVLATCESKSGEHASAWALCVEGLRVARQLVEAEPTAAVYERNLSHQLAWMATVAEATGRPSDAAAATEEAVVLLRGLVERGAELPESRRELVGHLRARYRMDVKGGRAALAGPLVDEATAHARILATAEGAMSGDFRLLAITLLLAEDRALAPEALTWAKRAVATANPATSQD